MNNSKYFLIRFTLFIFLFSANKVSAQVPAFNQTYHFGFRAAILNEIIIDSAIYTTGEVVDTIFPYTSGAIFSKIDLEGNPVVIKSFIDNDKVFYAGDVLIETKNNLLVRVSEIGDYIDTNDFYKIFLICYTKEGDTVFTREYISPFHDQFWIRDIVQTPDEGFMLAGFINNPASDDIQMYLLKTDSIGLLQWDEVYGAPDLDDYAGQILPQSNGKYWINATRTDYGFGNNFTFRGVLMEIDSLGNLLEEWETPEDQLRGAGYMYAIGNNEFIVSESVFIEKPINATTGQILIDGANIYKLNANMEQDWHIHFKDTVPSSVTGLGKIIKLSDGTGYLASGAIFESLIGVTDTGWNINGWVVKFTEQGDSLWSRYFHYWDTPFDEHYFYDMEQMPDGGVLLCGQANSGNAGPQQQLGWLVKLDEFGCLVPGCQLVATENIEGNPQGVALRLYPNPTSDILNIYTWSPHTPKNALLRIVSSDGQVVRESPVTRSDMTSMIPVRDIPAGVYFVQYMEEGMIVATEEAVIAR